jgi:hypothetical protein
LVSLPELHEDFVAPVPQMRLLEALESLRRRALIERTTATSYLQPVVMEYLTDTAVSFATLQARDVGKILPATGFFRRAIL